MKRRLFTILSALSLLLFVAVVVLWVRSFWRWDSISFTEERGFYILASADGDVVGVVTRHDQPVEPLQRWSADSRPAIETGFEEGVFALLFVGEWSTSTESMFGVTDTTWHLNVPFTYPAVATATLPTLWLIAHRRRRQRARNRCPSCGYDLRATPGRCPECGLVPAAPPPPPTSRGNVR